jgi:adenosylcobyric acid synthase
MAALRLPLTRFLVVWGTTSGAGKTWLTTALCRSAARRGINVAPFKAQNMSNNARVVPGRNGGMGEIGSAQYFQALAARVSPHTDMNPVLLKPEGETASQVVVNGVVDAALSRMPWRERSAALAPVAREGLRRLANRHDLIIIEGAGSPAEINLAADDYVNLGTARWAQERGPTAALLVSDIDRGGSFAHVYGTWALLPDDLRALLAGYVLNRFRGEEALLAPGPEELMRLTGVPLAGVLPMRRDHGLPEEDGVFDDRPKGLGTAQLHVAVLAPPHISNLDEFSPLARVPGVRLIWAREVGAVEGADWIILPGSKQTSGDLAWLRCTGLAAAVQRHAAAGKGVLGVCGGLQILGRSLHDPDGHDGQPFAWLDGLDLLPLSTHWCADKRLREARVHFGAPDGPWAALAGVSAPGYEIRCGRTDAPDAVPVLRDETGEAIGWQRGSVMGVYAHGLFESPEVIDALFGAAVPTLDSAFEALADLVDAHLDTSLVDRLLGGV